MNEIVLLQGAQADLLDIYSRRGDDGYAILDEELELIRVRPAVGPRYNGPFYRRVVPKTPFGIFYSITGCRILVIAVLDLRQDPEKILQRLNRS